MQLVNPKNIPPTGYRCWQRVFRPDGWIGLQPVEIFSVSVESANTEQSRQQYSFSVPCSKDVHFPHALGLWLCCLLCPPLCRCVCLWEAALVISACVIPWALRVLGLHAGDGAGVLYKGHAVIHPLLGPDLESPPNEAAPEESVGLDELFMDAVGESDKQRENSRSLGFRV